RLMTREFAIPEKELVTLELIQAHLGSELTVSEFLSLSDDDFLKIKGLGRAKLQHVAMLREIFASNEQLRSQRDRESFPTNSLILSQLALPHVYKATCNLLCNFFGEQLSVGELRALDIHSFRAIPRVGTKKIAIIKDMIKYIDEKGHGCVEVAEISSVHQGDGRKLYNLREDIELSTLENILIDDLDSFLSELDERDHLIMVGRLGYMRPSMTLQDIGCSLPTGNVTRERVRQLQIRIEKNWHAYMRVAPATLYVNVKSNLSLLRSDIFPLLQPRFNSKKGFYEFLEMSCGLESGEITKIVYPDIPSKVLDDYWAENSSPADLDSVTSYLQDRLGIEKAVAENAISNLSGKKLELLGGLILPLNLSKPLAIANTLLDYPDGLAWKGLHKKVNQKVISRAKLPEDRLDGAVGSAVDSGWIYQIERGSYRHISYLAISDNEINETLEDLLYVLKVALENGRDTLNLSVDYYQSLSNKKLDYFTVRHIVRTHGERVGVFFNGKSGADTVSLERSFSVAGQEKVLESLFAAYKAPLDKSFIASKIRSQSIGHASFYLDKLMTKGVVVRVDEAAYQLKELAFASIDISSVMNCAAEIIENEKRVIEVGVIQRRVNKKLDLDLNKYLYLSLLKNYHIEFGYNWHFSHNLVCREDIVFDSLVDLCRKTLTDGKVYEEDAWITVSQVCLIDDSHLKIVLGQLRNTIKRNAEDLQL
ncbi:hypothetical protein, partial [Aeromonas veronii]